VKQFIDGFNKGDVTSALATCASPVSIASDVEASAKKAGITGW
jgi:hypothetical protein